MEDQNSRLEFILDGSEIMSIDPENIKREYGKIIFHIPWDKKTKSIKMLRTLKEIEKRTRIPVPKNSLYEYALNFTLNGTDVDFTEESQFSLKVEEVKSRLERILSSFPEENLSQEEYFVDAVQSIYYKTATNILPDIRGKSREEVASQLSKEKPQIQRRFEVLRTATKVPINDEAAEFIYRNTIFSPGDIRKNFLLAPLEYLDFVYDITGKPVPLDLFVDLEKRIGWAESECLKDNISKILLSLPEYLREKQGINKFTDDFVNAVYSAFMYSLFSANSDKERPRLKDAKELYDTLGKKPISKSMVRSYLVRYKDEKLSFIVAELPKYIRKMGATLEFRES